MLMRVVLLEKTSLWFFKNSIFGAPVDIAVLDLSNQLCPPGCEAFQNLKFYTFAHSKRPLRGQL